MNGCCLSQSRHSGVYLFIGGQPLAGACLLLGGKGLCVWATGDFHWELAVSGWLASFGDIIGGSDYFGFIGVG